MILKKDIRSIILLIISSKMENDELYPVLLNFSSDKIIQELNTNSSL